MHPSQNIKLFGMNKYFNEILNYFNNDKMPNKILFSGNKGVGKSTLAYHLINSILSINEEHGYDRKNFTINDLNKSYKLIQNNTHPNFYLIDLVEDKKNIDISQIRKMIAYTNKSCLNDKPRFILIDNIEYLNNNSTNALLKVIEEPNDNVFFFLIHNNEKKILSTLKSRCLTFNINFSFTQNVKITNLILKDDISKLINIDLFNYYNSPGELVKLIKFAQDNNIDLSKYSLTDFLKLLIDNNYYKKNKFINNILKKYIELYFLKKYSFTPIKNSLLKKYHTFIKKVNNTEKFNLDEESLFLEFISKLINE